MTRVIGTDIRSNPMFINFYVGFINNHYVNNVLSYIDFNKCESKRKLFMAIYDMITHRPKEPTTTFHVRSVRYFRWFMSVKRWINHRNGFNKIKDQSLSAEQTFYYLQR